MTFFYHFGKYLLMLKGLVKRPEKYSIYWREIMVQMVSIGIGSVAIVAIVSIFLGAVTTVQTAYQFTSPLLSKSIIGTIITNSTILELAPTVTCLILAGKIGSNIASELGTMRISEQVDALEIMGVNSSAYLILPKIIACTVIIPLLIFISGFLCIYSGLLVGELTGVVSKQDFMNGSIEFFIPFTVFFAFVKTVTFGFIISSVSSYYGYYTEGGALEVGKSSTKAVVVCSVAILFADYVLALIML